MILRAFKKHAEPQALKPDIRDIESLATFGNLPEAMLRNIAEHSRFVEFENGDWPPAEAGWQRFLQQGELLLEHLSGTRHRLRTGDPGTGYPLPGDADWKIRALDSARLVEIPGRYLELCREQHASSGSNIELHEDDAEAQLYLEFHRELTQGNYELPALPDLAIRIGKAMDDPDTNNEDIARLVQLDPALSARLMSVVNSAAFAGSTPISSLQQAVARLGRQQVRNLVFSCIIKDLFRTESAPLRRMMKTLWTHSCRVAAICSVLARFTPGLDPDRALLAGLVHDIGVIPLLHTASNMPALAGNTRVLQRLITEMKAEVGQLTLQTWHFDPELCQLARHAENWHRIGTAIADYTDVVLVAQLHAFVGQHEPGDHPPIDAIPAFRKLALGKLTPRHSIGVLDKAAHEIDEVERLLH